MPERCTAGRADGTPCRNWRLPGSDFCRHHGKPTLFSGRRWTLRALCLEQEADAVFLSARYEAEGDPPAEKVLPVRGAASVLEDDRITTMLLTMLVGEGGLVFCRADETRQRLRDWLGRLVVTMGGGQQVPGVDLVDRVQPGPPPWEVPHLGVAAAGAEEKTPVPAAVSPIPEMIAQPTFPEARCVSIAIADGPALHRWHEVPSGEVALAHVIPGETLQTKLRAGQQLDWIGLPATHDSLRSELQRLEFPAVLLLQVTIALSLEQRGHVRVSLDDLVRALGWNPRSTTERTTMRSKVWRWLLLFDALQVIGDRRGTYRDPMTKRTIPTVSFGDLLHISGGEKAQMEAFDNSVPPVTVDIVAGSWLDRFRGNHPVLTYFGDVRRIASIPAGRASGSWARGIAMALNQRWRERAARAEVGYAGEDDHPTVRFPSFTRRDLLTLYRCQPDVEELLGGEHPNRACAYWTDAIAMLKAAEVIGSYREVEPLAEGRQRWREAWLGQPLDIRPAAPAVQAVAEIARGRANARKRRTKRTPAGGK